MEPLLAVLVEIVVVHVVSVVRIQVAHDGVHRHRPEESINIEHV